MTTLEALREAVELWGKATEGPWEWRGGFSVWGQGRGVEILEAMRKPEDSCFTAAARNLDLVAILEVVEAVKLYEELCDIYEWFEENTDDDSTYVIRLDAIMDAIYCVIAERKAALAALEVSN